MRAEDGIRMAEGSVLVCFPLKEEAAPFRKVAAKKSGLSILLTGIGRRNAEKSLRDSLTAHSPKMVLSCGFTGGLNPDLKLGDVIFEMVNAPLAPALAPPGGERVSARTGEGFNQGVSKPTAEDKSEPTDLGCCDLKDELVAAGARPATFFCADRIATTAAEKKRLRDETGADA